MDNLLRCCVFLCLYRHHVTSSTTIQNLQLEEFFEDVFPPQLDVCDTEDFEAECPLHHVIFVRSALYGRMELGRCVEHAFGYVGCFRDVLVLADRRCSGRTGCTIHVPNAEFENTRPCLKELKSFLRISYDCVRVENVTKEKCEQNPWLLLRPEQTNFPETTVGFIASIVTAEEAECADKPWFIQVQTGQRINLTLFDFSTSSQHKQANNFNHTSEDVQSLLRRKLNQVYHSNCQEYAVVEDGEKKFAVCGGEGQRVAWTYLSVEHQVKVWVTAGMAQNDMRRFILQYEVVGCPDPFLTDRVWFRKMSSNQATSGCIDSPQSWKLECFDQVWRPQVEQHPVNCSATTPENLTKRDEDHVEGTAYFSLTVTAIFFILVALVVSLTCLIRHYRKLVAQEGKEEDISKSKDSSDQHLNLQQQQQQQQQIQSDPQQHMQLLQTKLYNISSRSLCGQKFLNEEISSVSFSVPSNQLTASQLTPQFRLVTSPTSSRLKRGEHLLHADNLRFINEPSLTNVRKCQKSTTLF